MTAFPTDSLKIAFTTGTRVADIQDKYNHADLIEATNEIIDLVIGWVKDLPDSFVTLVPQDPDAHDSSAATEKEVTMAWTLGHVIVHMTASGEEATALASFLARGVMPEGRSRYETHWTTVLTIQQVLDRLEESRRIRLAYLNTWPDQPHLNLLMEAGEKHWGRRNAVGRVFSGLKHDYDHLGQLRDIIEQAKMAGLE